MPGLGAASVHATQDANDTDVIEALCELFVERGVPAHI